ncbi:MULTISPECIES: M35 family metallo-endopeptidase [Shewanella]|uniref:M35 family metallo-endopeptidase n=1 Tax=Shewanella TaxID=22 RepID=UPI001C65E460|nr:MULTISPECIES: M35 family metallo-endopeptidase [Shewanella]QYJ83613.1 peptidase M35 [Shewanella aegiceratis]QYJ94995.1 peptidase M35 [Shewanella spartinae]QYJ98826.1 peptidase M35 [Shewanella alkalitolerans]QYK14123.1 peptidase M35 [Shewanella rhizosphaerae]
MSKLFKLSTLAIATTLLSQSALAEGIAAKLQMSQDSFSSDQDVMVTLTLTNEANVPVKLLKWFTAADGVEESLFKVTADGQERPYLGAHYKRPAPSHKDYIKLKSGESISYQVELSSLYDMSSTANYEISYDVSSMQLFAPNPGQAKKLARLGVEGIHSAPASFYLEGREFKGGANKGKPGTGDGGGTTPDGISFTGRCSNSQQSDILAGLAAAKTMSADANQHLATASSNSQRYSTWFGAYSSSRWNTVSNNFSKIDSTLNNEPLTFDCSCKKQYYAYVYPTQPYKIYMCNAFWTAPTSGTDSKGGTIIHETSHFNVVAGTDDIVYGQSGAKSLAISDPSQAIQNADSHEYFAENTPNLN